VLLAVDDAEEFNTAAEHDEDTVGGVALIENRLAGCYLPELTERAEALDLRRVQFREHGGVRGHARLHARGHGIAVPKIAFESRKPGIDADDYRKALQYGVFLV